jgi:hypothetical protein
MLVKCKYWKSKCKNILGDNANSKHISLNYDDPLKQSPEAQSRVVKQTFLNNVFHSCMYIIIRMCRFIQTQA